MSYPTPVSVEPKGIRIFLDADEINDLDTTPYQVLPAPAPDEYIEVIRGDLLLNAGGTPFTAAGVLGLGYGSGFSQPVMQWGNAAISPAVDSLTPGELQSAAIQNFVSAPLFLSNTGAISGGDGTIVIYLLIQVLKFA